MRFKQTYPLLHDLPLCSKIWVTLLLAFTYMPVASHGNIKQDRRTSASMYMLVANLIIYASWFDVLVLNSASHITASSNCLLNCRLCFCSWPLARVINPVNCPLPRYYAACQASIWNKTNHAWGFGCIFSCKWIMKHNDWDDDRCGNDDMNTS